MKRINKIFGLSFSLVAVFGLISCSNEVSEPSNNDEVDNGSVLTFNLVKSPDVIAWSGSEVLGNTFGLTKSIVTDGDYQYYRHDDEVEVNFSLLNTKEWKVNDDTNIADLVSKLSIHVRCATNVEVTIPIPADYFIESDDLAIFHEHYGKDVFGDETENMHGAILEKLLGENAEATFTYENVTLNVSFDEEGIHVSTNGITEDILESFMSHNNDGINFEIYNYYQTSTVADDGTVTPNGTNKHDLLTHLQKNVPTISFSENNPPLYYINAFGWKENEDYDYEGGNSDGDEWHANEVNPNDLVVVPSAGSGYNKVIGPLYDEHSQKIEGTDNNDKFYHINGTPFNIIYKYGVGNADHAHGGAPEPKPENIPVGDNS